MKQKKASNQTITLFLISKRNMIVNPYAPKKQTKNMGNVWILTNGLD